MGVRPAIACSSGRVGEPLSQPRAVSGRVPVNHGTGPRSANIDELEGAFAGGLLYWNVDIMIGVDVKLSVVDLLADMVMLLCVGCRWAAYACCGARARPRKPLPRAVQMCERLLAGCIGPCMSCVSSCYGDCSRGACVRRCEQLLGLRVLRCCWAGRPPGRQEE